MHRPVRQLGRDCLGHAEDQLFVDRRLAQLRELVGGEVHVFDPQRPRLSERIPWIVAFLFGLLHGFGFAGALSEIGLPQDDVAAALLTFNLGVEAGQLMIVALCLAILWLLRRYGEQYLRPVVLASTYIIGIMASFWLFDRLL